MKGLDGGATDGLCKECQKGAAGPRGVVSLFFPGFVSFWWWKNFGGVTHTPCSDVKHLSG